MKKFLLFCLAIILLSSCGTVPGTDVPIWHQFAGWIGGGAILVAILLITKTGSIDFKKAKEGELIPILKYVGITAALLGALTLFSILYGSGCN